MAIKRLRVNAEGEHEERQLESSELPPPPAKPLPRERARRSRTPKADSPARVASPVKVTKRAGKVLPAGRTVLDEGVIRYICTQCESSRIVSQVLEKAPECSMCQKPMRLQAR